jgi:hypothetical protein
MSAPPRYLVCACNIPFLRPLRKVSARLHILFSVLVVEFLFCFLPFMFEARVPTCPFRPTSFRNDPWTSRVPQSCLFFRLKPRVSGLNPIGQGDMIRRHPVISQLESYWHSS